METIYNNDLRTLTNSELIGSITTKVTETYSTFEEVIESLTPSRKKFALALMEVYKRYQGENKKPTQITSPNQMYDLMRSHLYGVQHEECWVIFMNQASKVIKVQRMSVGGIAEATIDIRMILKEAFLCNSTVIAMVHNHPSGNKTPSTPDDHITKQLSEACKLCNIRLLDHVIFCGDDFYSYVENCKL